METLIQNGVEHKLATPFVGLYRALEYKLWGGSDMPHISILLLKNAIPSTIHVCNGYFEN